MKLISALVWTGIVILFLALLALPGHGQVTVALAPVPKLQFLDANGAPLAGGCLFTYSAGTTTVLATYNDSTGLIQNSNPVILDSGGFASVWLTASLYKFALWSNGGVNCATGSLQYTIDNLSNQGLIAQSKAVLLSPAGNVNQTVSGTITAPSFIGSSSHTTSTGVRVAILAPTTVLDSALNPPNMIITSPAGAGQNYRVYDPLGHSNFVLSPDPTQAGGNTLDCSNVTAGLTCKRYGYAWFEGASCNNATAAMGWDTFGVNSPSPKCITGTFIQKGVLALPSAASKDQEQSVAANCNTTCTLTYPAATAAGDLLLVAIAVDGGKTVSSVSDGTNAYTKATSTTNGNTDIEVWYFNGNSTGMAAASTLTVTLSAQANAAIDWFAYKDIKTAALLDVTATNTGATTAVTTGTTAGTAQNTELVFSAVGSPSNPTVAFQTGTTGHSTVSQSTNVTVSSEGKIQQATTTQSGSFTLGTAQNWAAVVVTFKANVGDHVQAQRHFMLPSTFVSSLPINANIKWQAPLAPTGTINVALSGGVGCTADGSTDDPSLGTTTTAMPVVGTGSALTTTTFSGMTPTPTCAAGNFLHFIILRERYNAADTYEGYVYVNGAGLLFGLN